MGSRASKQKLEDIQKIIADQNIHIQDKRTNIGNEKNHQFVTQINEFLSDENMATEENIKFLDDLILYCGFPIPFFGLSQLSTFYQNCQQNSISEQQFTKILINLRQIYSCNGYDQLKPTPPELELINDIEKDVRMQKDFKGFGEVKFKSRVFQFDKEIIELKTNLFIINQKVENEKFNQDVIQKAQLMDKCHQDLLDLQTLWEGKLKQQEYHIDKEIIKIMLSLEIQAAIQNIESEGKQTKKLLKIIGGVGGTGTGTNSQGSKEKDNKIPIKKNTVPGKKTYRNDVDGQIMFSFRQFAEGEIVDFEEDQFVQFKDYTWPFKDNSDLVKSVCKEICAFMNADGGLLIFGIDDLGCVKGFRLTQKQKDEFSLFISHQFNQFIPAIQGKQIECLFYPVRNSNNTGWAYQSWIAVIKINPCRNEIDNPNSLYVFTIPGDKSAKNSIFSYERTLNNCSPQDAAGIIEDIIQRSAMKNDHSKYKFKIFLEQPNPQGVEEIDQNTNAPMIIKNTGPKNFNKNNNFNYNNNNNNNNIKNPVPNGFQVNPNPQNPLPPNPPNNFNQNQRISQLPFPSTGVFGDYSQLSTYFLAVKKEVQGLDWVKLSGFVQIEKDDIKINQIGFVLQKEGIKTQHSGSETLCVCQKDVYFLIEETQRSEMLKSFEIFNGGMGGFQFFFLYNNGRLQLPQIQQTAIIRNFDRTQITDLMLQLNIIENSKQYQGKFILVWFEDKLKSDEFLQEFQSKDLSKFNFQFGNVACHSLSNQANFELSDDQEASDLAKQIESNKFYYNFIPNSLGNTGQIIKVNFFNSPDMFRFYEIINKKAQTIKPEFIE